MHYLTDPLQFEFMRRALMAIVLTGIASGVLGSYVVLRGLAFIGDALTHAVFPGIVVAVALGRSILLGALVVGLITALGIATVSRGRRVSEDTGRVIDRATFRRLVDAFPYPVIRLASPLVGESRGEIAARRSDSC